MFKFQSYGEVYRSGVVSPAMVVAKESGLAQRFGTLDEMIQCAKDTNASREVAISKKPEIADFFEPVVVVELPHDQKEIDKAFGAVSYAKELYEKSKREVSQ